MAAMNTERRRARSGLFANPIKELNILFLLRGHPAILEPLLVCRDSTHVYAVTEICVKMDLLHFLTDNRKCETLIDEEPLRQTFLQLIKGP